MLRDAKPGQNPLTPQRDAAALSTFSAIRDWVIQYIADRLGVASAEVAAGEHFQRVGLDSLGATTLLIELGKRLGYTLSPTLIWEFPSADALAQHLSAAKSDDEIPAQTPAWPASEASGDPIAIVGMACRFPQADDLAAFWDLLRNGIDAIREAPAGRWHGSAPSDREPSAAEESGSRFGGFIQDVETFDPGFFGISPREATLIDPQQRLALELSWEALEDAGIPATAIRGGRGGVFVGVIWHDYADLLLRADVPVEQHTGTGQSLSIVANRISYALGLQGPSLAIDTACSSSLVAIHLACHSLRTGESSLALVGGVNLMLSPHTSEVLSKFGGLSPRGRCRAFDAGADGFVRGEGGGFVVLKPLSHALADGDHVYCVIRGSAVNNDGASNGLTAPNPAAQRAVLAAACQQAQISPTSIDYVEAHGTGTKLGDPIEAAALGAVLSAGRPASSALRIGSVKTNIGHLEGAAGIAGLIKTALAIEHRSIPPSLHFAEANPLIPFSDLKLVVATQLEPWPSSSPAVAGVSSFGWGGTNCHVIVSGLDAAPPQLLRLAAADHDSLRRAAQTAVSHALRGPEDIAALCSLPQSDGTHRLAVIARSHPELAAKLETWLADQAVPGCHTAIAPKREKRIAFVYSPQGGQWRGMASRLLRESTVFRQWMQSCDAAIARHGHFSILRELHRPTARSATATFIQPCLFAVQVALTALLDSLGVSPDYVVGHSLGEISAACVSGALSLDDAARVIVNYSRLQDTTAGDGGMALVQRSTDETNALLAPYADAVCMAGQNGPQTTLLSGRPAALDAIVETLRQQGTFAARIDVQIAAHSPQMDPILEPLATALRGITPRPGRVPMWSTSTRGWVQGQDLDGTWFAHNLRSPVYFDEAVRALCTQGAELFVEVNTHPILQPSIQQSLQHCSDTAITCGTLIRGEPELAALLNTAAQVWTHGGTIRASSEPSRLALAADTQASDAQLVVLSAQSERALAAQLARLDTHLRAQPEASLPDLAYSLATTRSALRKRVALLATSTAALQQACAAAQGDALTQIAATASSSPETRAFLFTGQGAQTPGMGRGLYHAFPAFRETFDRVVRLFDRQLAGSLRAVMWAPADHADSALLDQTGYTQPALFTLEYALLALWQTWGIVPDHLAGHSIGELVAACIAGVFSLEDAVRLCSARGQLMQALPTGGAMASIAAKEASVAAAIAARSDLVSIAAINGPEQVVVAGEQSSVEEIVAAFAARHVRTKLLRVSHAFHSPRMDPMLADFRRVAQSIRYRAPTRPLISNLTGKLADDSVCTAEYWVRHVREAVRFVDGTRALGDAGVRTFIEIGPKSTLLSLVSAALPNVDVTLVPSLRAGCEESQSALEALGSLWTRGASVDWDGVFPWRRGRCALPSYAFERTRCWPAQAPRRSVTQPAVNASLHYTLDWPERSRVPSQDLEARAGTWLVVTEREDSGWALARALASHGRSARVLSAQIGDSALITELHACARLEGVVVLSDAPLPAEEALAGRHLHERILPAASSLLTVIRGLSAGSSARLWIITRGAWAIVPGKATNYLQAVLWGAGRVAAAENPAAWGGLIDLDPLGDAGEFDALAHELLQPQAEDQLAFRSRRRHAARLESAPVPTESLTIASDATYLVTGGLGALGLCIAEWLAARGARHLVLTSRRGVPPRSQWTEQTDPAVLQRIAQIQELEARGVQVTAAAIDVSDGAQMSALVSSAMPAVRGVFHAAGVLSVGLLAQKDAAQLAAVLHPKVDGAWALHQATRNIPLDFFVLFSSVAGTLGPMGSGLYAAANAALDSFAEYRRAQGLPAVSIAWGAWATGMALRLSPQQLSEPGVRMMPLPDALTMLGHVMRGPAACCMVASIDWRKLAAALPPGTRQRQLIARFVRDERDVIEASAESPDPQPTAGRAVAAELPDRVRRCVAQVLGLNAGNKLEATQRFGELGMDSLMAVQLHKALQHELGVPLSSTVAFDYPTLDRLVAHLRSDVLKVASEEAIHAELPLASNEPIAVVGMALRFPGDAADAQSAWSLLRAGTDVVQEVPASRWKAADWYDPNPDTPNRTMVTRGGFLTDVESFDAGFFHVAPVEVLTMDPQQRMLLEVSWEALERAGQDPIALRETQTGVFVCAGENEYAERLQGMSDAAAARYSGTGNLSSVLAGRLSYFLGLQGPSLFVDTACSSSLVALHLACQSLHAGECTSALVGGVNLLLSPRSFVMMSQFRALSPDGRCRTFAADADGYGRSEGCVVLVLKRESDALRAGDPILGLVRGSAINHDGPSSGLTAPNGPAQQAVLRQALEHARVSPRDVDYVECHGTGTKLGDPIEVQALAAVYGEQRQADRPLWIGAVKAHLGHMEAASGLAGIVKLLLSLQHEELPAQPALRDLNPHIPWRVLPVRVLQQAQTWRRGSKPRIAGISSFGLSGTNAHVIVQEAPALPVPAAGPARSAELIVLSAHSEAALRSQAARLRMQLGSSAQVSLADAAHGLSCHRAALPQRATLVATSRDDLLMQLEALSAGTPRAGTIVAALAGAARPQVVFVFPGQGSQWLGMGQTLLQEEPRFAEALTTCDQAIQKEAGFSVLAELMADATASRLQQVDVVQPVLFAMSVALAALWRSWGITPDVVVGHSLGEIAAAHVAGALSLQDAAAVICRRSRLLRQISGQGEMALVDLSADETAALLVGLEDRLSIAVSNGPRATVISGDPGALSMVLSLLAERGVFSRHVKVDVASHSPQVEPLLPELRRQLSHIQPRPCAIPMRSTVTTTDVIGLDLDAEYWVQNLRQPVRFGAVLQSLLDSGTCQAIELSAHPVLLPAIEEILSASSTTSVALASLRRGQPERAALLSSLAALWCAGVPVTWPQLFPSPRPLPDLPTYAWQRERFWVDPSTSSIHVSHPRKRLSPSAHPLLGSAQTLSTQSGTHVWEQVFEPPYVAWLRDHRVQGTMIFPGAAYLEMALACAHERFSADPADVTELALVEALSLPPERALILQAVTTEEMPGRLRFQVASRDASQSAATFRVHARGVLKRRKGSSLASSLDLVALRERLRSTEAAEVNRLYEDMAAMGMEYGDAFRGIRELWCGDSEALGRIELPAAAKRGEAGYLFHPALLDGCLQILMAALGPERGHAPWLPVYVGALQLYETPPGELFCHAQLLPRAAAQPDRQRAQLAICDHTGRVVAELRDFVVQRRAESTPHDHSERWFLSPDWHVKAVQSPRVTSGRWLLLGDGGALGRTLRDVLLAAGHAVAQGESLLPNSTALRVLLTASFGDKAPTAVVHLGRVGVEGTSESSIPEKALLQGCDSVLHVVQALVGMWYREVPRLWLFTRGAQAVGNGPISLTQAPLLGLGRTIAVEHPELRCLRVDLDPARPDGEAEAILAELLADEDEDEIALRGRDRLVSRLVHRQPEVDRSSRKERAAGQPFRLNIEQPGVLDHLFLQRCVRRPPGPNEVEISVEAAGLNFMDVMTAMGIRPGANGAPALLGNECAGRVVAVGEGVQDLHIGQAVVAATPGSFATHVTVASCKVVTRPERLDAAQAAALPIAYMTAWYGLVHLARLRAGERVLIHSATGGTGLAAVHIARHLGAEIFATAGSEQKREWLRAQGIRHVMDSRSLDFASQILAATQDEGVDVVLNSLSGSAIEASFSALGQDGRFIELGKTDIYSDRPLGLSPFKKSLSYSAVDLAALSERRPERFGRLLSEVMSLIAAAVLPPLPLEAVPISRAADAFRKMAQAQHMGKLVLTLSEPDVLVRSPQRAEVPIRSDASYLVTGGLGGLGLKIAEWLGSQGAGHLVLMGRAGDVSFEQRACVSALVAKGTRVSIAKGDVANRLQLEHILSDIQGSGMPLRGIVHAAGALDDGLIMQQTPLRFRTVMGPKVQGAWHLHELTRAVALDFFVMYSSAAGLLGSAGQANYAAANTFLDALAHHRRSYGLPALSIDWGAFSEVGLASEQENRGARLATRGMESLTPEQGIVALHRLLANDVVQMGVVPLDVQRWGEFYRAAASARRLSCLHSAAAQEPRSEQGAHELRVRLAQAVPTERANLLAEILLKQAAQVLRLSANQIPISVPLSTLGMDSLMGLELRNRIESVLGIRVPASLLWTHPTVAVLSEYLLREVTPDSRQVPRPKEPAKHAPPLTPPGQAAGSVALSSTGPVGSRGSALIRLHTAASPKLHLICFPPGGGGPELFQRWATKLPQLVSISGLHLPGRGARLTEPPYSDMRQLLHGIRDELTGALDSGTPVAFVGHSFGSVLAFEAACQIAVPGRTWPVHLFVSACAAPRRGSELERYLGFGKQDVQGTFSSDALSDAELLDILRRAGALGRGADKLDEDELAAFFIPTLRADLRVLRTYTREEKRVLPIPITAIVGRQDPMIDANHITEWMGHTSDSFSARIICADHGIRYEQMWSIISSQLASLLDVPAEL